MNTSFARVALAALLGVTAARAEEPPQRPAERPRPQLPETRAPAPAPSSPLPTPGVNPAENLPADQLSPATNDELFADPAAEMVEGTNVHLENLVVRAKSGVLLRASANGQQIFVAPIDPSWLDFVAIGATIDVRGTLIDAPSAGQAQLVFAMNKREARRLARSRVYVDAWSVTTR